MCSLELNLLEQFGFSQTLHSEDVQVNQLLVILLDHLLLLCVCGGVDRDFTQTRDGAIRLFQSYFQLFYYYLWQRDDIVKDVAVSSWG